jgi:16S rRNA (cytosine967-C5)-methyltransferase
MDRVLVDAPCSGTGTLRRNPDLKWRIKPQELDELVLLQKAILDSAAKMVKPGGRLVYATCSLLQAENEDVAQAFTAANDDFEVVPVAQLLVNVLSKEDGEDVDAVAAGMCHGDFLRLWPHVHATDGFFAAIWTRKHLD